MNALYPSSHNYIDALCIRGVWTNFLVVVGGWGVAIWGRGLGRHVCQKTTILHRRMVSTFYYSTAAALIFLGGRGGL